MAEKEKNVGRYRAADMVTQTERGIIDSATEEGVDTAELLVRIANMVEEIHQAIVK